MGGSYSSSSATSACKIKLLNSGGYFVGLGTVSAALQYQASAGHQWYYNGTQVMALDSTPGLTIGGSGTGILTVGFSSGTINLTAAANGYNFGVNAGTLGITSAGNIGFISGSTTYGKLFSTGRWSFGNTPTDDTVNTFQITGRTKINGQVSYGGSTPSIAAGTGAGTSPTVSIVGTNNGGVITVTTGTLPSSSAILITVTYTGAFATGSQIILYPTNSNTSLLSGVSMVYTTGTTSTFTITTGTTALTAATIYSWAYVVTGY